jgi:hypothetical protein
LVNVCKGVPDLHIETLEKIDLEFISSLNHAEDRNNHNPPFLIARAELFCTYLLQVLGSGKRGTQTNPGTDLVMSGNSALQVNAAKTLKDISRCALKLRRHKEAESSMSAG